MRSDPLHNLLRVAALSAALIAGGAATALADVPGSYFPDEWQPRHASVQAQATPPAATAGMPALPAALGRAASNRLPPGAAHARSAG